MPREHLQYNRNVFKRLCAIYIIFYNISTKQTNLPAYLSTYQQERKTSQTIYNEKMLLPETLHHYF